MEAPTSLDAPVLPARGPEDLLAYVGHALGRLPEGSLVLLTPVSYTHLTLPTNREV